MFIGNTYFQNDITVPKRCKNYHPNYFYVLRCHKGRTRYIKIGTTSKTPYQRFKHYPYTIDEIYCIVECFNGVELAIEQNCRTDWRLEKGLTHIPKDRFTYFCINKDKLKEMIIKQIQIFEK